MRLCDIVTSENLSPGYHSRNMDQARPNLSESAGVRLRISPTVQQDPPQKNRRGRKPVYQKCGDAKVPPTLGRDTSVKIPGTGILQYEILRRRMSPAGR